MTPRPEPDATGAVEIDPAAVGPGAMYHLLNALVVPRPIAWVSTRDNEGRANLAPHSYFTAVSNDPPMVLFSSLGHKDTVSNLEQVGEFVVNVASSAHVGPMNTSSADMPAGQDEFVWAGLEKCDSATVSVPGVVGVPARIECVVEEILPRGNGLVVLGRVSHVHVDGSAWRDGRVDVAALDPLCRLAGSDYAVLGERISIPRPKWADLAPDQAPRDA